MFAMGYLAYLLADAFALSGIITYVVRMYVLRELMFVSVQYVY